MGPTPSVNLHYSVSLHAYLLFSSSPRTIVLFLLVSFSLLLFSSYFCFFGFLLQAFSLLNLWLYSLLSILHHILYLLAILFLLHVHRITPFPVLVHKMKSSVRGGRIFSDDTSKRGQKFGRLKNTDPLEDDFPDPHNNTSAPDSSPYNDTSSPFSKSPWSAHVAVSNPLNTNDANDSSSNVLIGSLVREEGHIYSLAASGDLLYTGSDSKNIRVWKNNKEFSGFKSNSGLVKAIVIAGEKIFTGHQDGKIRVWKVSSRDASVHKRVGTLPTFRDYIKNSMKPSNYVEVKKHRNTLWIKHFDAISSLSLSEDKRFLYSASWDKTFKVWRSSDYKCLESVIAHDDAVNSIVAGFDGLVFTGSADGTVKVWRRELQGKGTKHFFSQTLLKQECAVTAVALNPDSTVVYCGSSDGLVNFWEKEKHLSHGGVLRGHKLAILCLVAAGSLVFSGSADMGICIWRRTKENEHICLSMLTGHSGPVKCLAVERYYGGVSGGESKWILYSGSLDKSVKMWQVSEEAPAMIGSQQDQVKSDGGNCKIDNNNNNDGPTGLPYAPSFSSQGRC